MSEKTQLANDPAARTESGAIIDQKTSFANTETTKETPPSTDTVKTEPSPNSESSALPKSEGSEAATPKEGETLLTKKDEAPVVPEKYEPFKVPEGFTLDEAVSTEAGTIFKELGLSQDQGQKLVDFYTAKTVEAAQAPYKQWADTQEAWVKEVKADPEIGNKLPEVKATIAKAIDSLGPQLSGEFRSSMDYTGAGNNPAFIKAFYKFAQQLTEGSHVSGRGPSKFGQSSPGDKPTSAASAMFPNLPSSR